MDPTPPAGIRMLSRFGACLTCRRRKLEQIKELEAKIEEIEHQRGSSRASGSPGHNKLDGLSPQSVAQAASPACTSDGFTRQATDLSPHLVPAASTEMNTLLRRGPFAMSLPGETSRKLLNMFMQRMKVSGFELHMVPALYYAMLLLGCHFSPEPELKFWEGMFHERTRLELETNIARAHSGDRSKYNPLHHLQAIVLLGQWFYFKSRLLEAHVYTTHATWFAVTLGLHELDSRIYGHYVVASQESSHKGVERWRPRDPIELGEAINLWWACFERDFGGTLVNGLPATIPPEEVKTVWPVSLSEFEEMSGAELSNDIHSARSLLDLKYLHIVADVSQDTPHCLLAKGVMLTHCAGMLDAERMSSSEVTDEWLARFEVCDRATKIFTESAQKSYAGRDIEEVAIIALAQTAVDCVILQLHAPLVDYGLGIGAQGGSRGLLSDDSLGGYSYTRCAEASRSIALTSAYIESRGVDTSYMQLFFGVSWSCAAMVLAKQIPGLRQSGYTAQAQEMEQQLAVMARNMERLLLAYPVLALQAEQLRALLR